MKWIGLTGSIGSGKSTVAALLRQKGEAVVDADQFAKNAVAPGSEGERKVFATFGQDVRCPDGSLDRKKLADIVFADPNQLKKLETIVHPLVQAQTKAAKERLTADGRAIAFYDVPLLFEKNMEPLFDGIVVVHARGEICVQRAMNRSQMSRSEAEARLKNQLAIEEKIRRAHWTIENNGTLEDLEKAVEKTLQDIGRKFPKGS